MAIEQVILAVIIGTLAGIVYSLRILVLMERRVARIEMHMERLVQAVLQDEEDIKKEEDKILREESDIEKRFKKKR